MAIMCRWKHLLILFVVFLSVGCESKKPSNRAIRVNFNGFETFLKSGKIYRIDSSNGLTLTASKEGHIKPQPVILSAWVESPSQLWEANRIDEGYVFTPLENDFNEFSYFLEKQADSFQVWNLGKAARKIKGVNLSGMYLLRNSKLQCLEGFGENEKVGINTCRGRSIHQYWMFYEVEEPAESS